MHYERALAHRRRPDRDTGHGVLAIRDVEHTGAPESPVRLGGGAEDTLEVVHADASHEDAGVRLHALHGGLADRLPVA